MVEPVTSSALRRVIAFFETMRPQDVAGVSKIYAEDARFRDPFNDVRGPGAIERIFTAMFVRLAEPRFVVHDAIEHEGRAFLTWDLEFRFRRGDSATLQHIHGATLLRFDADGLITEHRDYWDAAGELYEKLPFVGALMRWLRHRASH
ncbi:MAG: nuclear transport factor 2 family protein [Burkholderiales bacterium]|nr:MAG: nuclear transport factor 2 family protein [Burkholderiales bacterium]